MTLDHSLRQLQQFGLIPVIGAELEFYVPEGLAEQGVLDTLACLNPEGYPPEKERGSTQYEIATQPQRDIHAFIASLEALRQEITATLKADFSAKPHADDYGNALHLHVHLEDSRGVNQFTRDAEGEYSKPMLYSIGGLLATMKEALPIFSPHDRSRFETPGMHAPTHLCWGPNNRSVALRLPDKPLNQKHIEHRVSAADAEITDCVEAILQGVIYGLKEETLPPAPIYGNAWEAQYGLEALLLNDSVNRS